MKSELECTICHTKFIIQRTGKHKFKEKNHIKHLYCLKCKKRTPHVENKGT